MFDDVVTPPFCVLRICVDVLRDVTVLRLILQPIRTYDEKVGQPVDYPPAPSSYGHLHNWQLPRHKRKIDRPAG